MPWFKLDDNFFDHPKVVRAGGDAALLYLAALCYANKHLTNGIIPDAAVARLTDRKQPEKLAERLVEVGLWEPSGPDYYIHDYLDLNDTADVVREKRGAAKAKKQEAGRVGGRRSAEARKQANGKQEQSTTQAGQEHGSKQNGSTLQAKLKLGKVEAESKPDVDADADADGRSSNDPPISPRGDCALGKAANGKQRALVDAWRPSAGRILDALNAARWVDGRRTTAEGLVSFQGGVQRAGRGG